MIIGLSESHTWGFSGSVDHLAGFSVDPPGVLVLTRHWDGTDTWLTVKRADSEVQISHQLLDDFAAGGDNDGMYPDVRFAPGPGEGCMPCVVAWRGIPCFKDWLLHIDARDRHVVYRIGEYDAKRDAWVARWPD